MICVLVSATLPHASVTFHVRVIVPPQAPPVIHRPHSLLFRLHHSCLSMPGQRCRYITDTFYCYCSWCRSYHWYCCIIHCNDLSSCHCTLPHASVTFHVRVIVPPQAPPVNRPSTLVTVPPASQLSVHARSAVPVHHRYTLLLLQLVPQLSLVLLYHPL